MQGEAHPCLWTQPGLVMVPNQGAKWLTLVFLPDGGKPAAQGFLQISLSQLSTSSLGNVLNRRGFKSY